MHASPHQKTKKVCIFVPSFVGAAQLFIIFYNFLLVFLASAKLVFVSEEMIQDLEANEKQSGIRKSND